MRRVVIIKSVIVALAVSMIGAQPTLAYIDPNTGGQLFQLLVVVFTFFSAILLFFSSYIKMAFARGKRLMRNLFGKDAKVRGEGMYPSSLNTEKQGPESLSDR